MKIKTRSNFWIYCVCTVSAIIILYALNWVLKLPAITDVIGDENTWLPIVADAIISGVIFIGGNWYANADRLRNDIQHKKSEFQIISESVNRVINSLNISRRQLSILYSIEISMDTPSLIKEVLEIQQEIDEAQQQFARSKYLISDTSKVSAFEDCVKTVSAAYHVVFDTIMIGKTKCTRWKNEMCIYAGVGGTAGGKTKCAFFRNFSGWRQAAAASTME